jgi:hypothetical protein
MGYFADAEGFNLRRLLGGASVGGSTVRHAEACATRRIMTRGRPKAIAASDPFSTSVIECRLGGARHRAGGDGS